MKQEYPCQQNHQPSSGMCFVHVAAGHCFTLKKSLHSCCALQHVTTVAWTLASPSHLATMPSTTNPTHNNDTADALRKADSSRAAIPNSEPSAGRTFSIHSITPSTIRWNSNGSTGPAAQTGAQPGTGKLAGNGADGDESRAWGVGVSLGNEVSADASSAETVRLTFASACRDLPWAAPADLLRASSTSALPPTGCLLCSCDSCCGDGVDLPDVAMLLADGGWTPGCFEGERLSKRWPSLDRGVWVDCCVGSSIACNSMDAPRVTLDKSCYKMNNTA